MTVLKTICDEYDIFINTKDADISQKKAGDFIAQKTPTCALMDPRIP